MVDVSIGSLRAGPHQASSCQAATHRQQG